MAPAEQTIYHGEFVMFSALAALLLAAIFTAARGEALPIRTAQALLLGLLLLEGSAAHWLTVSERDDPIRAVHLRRLEEPAGALAFLKSQPQPFRFEMLPGGGGINLGDWHGLESVEGYLTVVSGNVYRLMDQTGWVEGKLLLNTVYTIAREPTRPEQQEVYRGPDGWNVYRNPDAAPRAWIEPEAGCSSAGTAEVFRSGADWVTLRTEAPCPGTLVVSAVWAPGWRATVNGEERPVNEVHTALRGVPIEAGRSEIELRYEPASVRIGGALSLGGALAVAFGALWRRRSGRRTAGLQDVGP